MTTAMPLHTNLPADHELRITGMDCADCALTLERSIARLEGVDTCEVNFAAGNMRVSGSAELAAIEARIQALGYGIGSNNPEAAPVPAGQPSGIWRYLTSRKDTRLALIGLILLALGFAANLLGGPPWIGTGLHGLVVLLAGTPIMRMGWRELRFARNVTINLLMSIATLGALAIGETGEAATVIVLFAIGEALEGFAAERARYSLRSLLDLVPQQATVLRPCVDCAEHFGQDGYDGGPCPYCAPHEVSIPVEQLTIGETVYTRPGERIPMDGNVRGGISAVNQAPITGESIPVPKQPGDEVFAGTINGTGALEIEITHLAADNTLSRIIQLVEEAQSNRAPTQRFIDQFARWYTPAIVILALGLAVLPPLVVQAPFWDTPTERGWLYRALALLIIACPCALVISTPVTIVSALTRAARQGILIKGGGPLEALAGVRVFAFDKTGTLTQGQPELITAHAIDCQTDTDDLICEPCTDLLAIAAAIERRSEHPLAQAVVNAAHARQVLERYPAAQDVTSLTGKGVQGQVNDRQITIGSHRYFDEAFPHPDTVCQQVAAHEALGATTMLLAEDDKVRGWIAVADQPRANSRDAVRALKTLRPEATTVMLTGDNATTARAIATQIGVDDVRANMLPADKLTTIQTLMSELGPTAMVGDGINDAPALAAATVGVAMGGAGSAQAMETADIVLMQDDLSRLPAAVALSRLARHTIQQNIGLSLGLKALVLLLTLFGSATLWMAVFADVGASLLVTGNGLRLLRGSEKAPSSKA